MYFKTHDSIWIVLNPPAQSWLYKNGMRTSPLKTLGLKLLAIVTPPPIPTVVQVPFVLMTVMLLSVSSNHYSFFLHLFNNLTDYAMLSSTLSIVLVSSSIRATWIGRSSIAFTLTGSSGLIELLGQPTEM